MGALNYKYGDLYPDMGGFFTTRTETIPEAYDQNALTDDQDMAEQNAIRTTPTQHRNIWVTLIAVFVFLFIFSKF